MICFNKFGSAAGIREHMRKQAALIKPKFDAMTLKYTPSKELFEFTILDWDGKAFKTSVKAPFAVGAWHHVAIQWDPSQTADLYLDGKRLFFILQGSAPTKEQLYTAEWTMERFAGLYRMLQVLKLRVVGLGSTEAQVAGSVTVRGVGFEEFLGFG